MKARFSPSRKAGRANTSDAEIGHGKPPREHQFKQGKSGNPRGRPKGAKSETTILQGLLNRKIEIREAGRDRKITVLEAILLRFAEDALKGNTKTAAFLLDRYASTQTGEPESSELSPSDRDVLDDFVRRFQSQRRAERKRR
jgi:hypothetical protein